MHTVRSAPCTYTQCHALAKAQHTTYAKPYLPKISLDIKLPQVNTCLQKL
jgi:hypothetical protein